MIERYFVKGFHYKWMKPADDGTGARDGSIVAQLPFQNTMTYQSIDGDIYDLMAPNIRTLGLVPGSNVSFNWLNYKLGHTSKIPLTSDTLTGFMSGCYICTWSENGARQVGHIGTVTGMDQLNQNVRRVFREAMPHDVQGYNPAGHWDFGEILTMQNKLTKTGANAQTVASNVVSLVTSTGEFYSMIVFRKLKTYEFIMGGIKRVQPMAYAELRSKLGGAVIGMGRGV